MQNNTFSTLFVGQNFIRLLEVDSTNNFLKAMVSNSEPLPEGTVIMADNQFAGRGQRDNIWHTAPGLNLTFSIYLSPVFLPIHRQFLLNMAVSAGIKDGLAEFLGESMRVKWPNDLYYSDQKFGGILIENILSGTTYKACIVGIGINVNQLIFDPVLKNRVTSIGKILQRDVNLVDLLAKLCSHIESQYLKLRSGIFEKLKQDYTAGLYKFGKLGMYRHNGETFEGMIVDVTDNGLLVIHSNGLEKQYNFKEVEFLNNI